MLGIDEDAIFGAAWRGRPNVEHKLVLAHERVVGAAVLANVSLHVRARERDAAACVGRTHHERRVVAWRRRKVVPAQRKFGSGVRGTSEDDDDDGGGGASGGGGGGGNDDD